MSPSLFFAEIDQDLLGHITASVLLLVLTLWLTVIAFGSAGKVRKKKKGGHIGKAIFSGLLAGVAALVTLLWFIGLAMGLRVRDINGVKSVWINVSSPDKTVKIAVPADWHPSHSHPESILFFTQRNGRGMIGIEAMSKEDYKGTLDDKAAKSSANLEKAIGNGPVEAVRQTVAGGYPARVSRVISHKDSEDTIVMSCDLEAKDHFYQILAVVPVRDESTLVPVVEAIRETFETKEGPPDSAAAKDAEVH